MDAGRFDDLLDRFRNGEASPEEVAELERLLRADPAHRRNFVTSLLLDVHLRRAFSGIVPPPLPPPLPLPSRQSLRRVIVWASAAALLLLSVGLEVVLFVRSRDHRTTVASGETTVVSGEVRVRGVAVSQVAEETSFETAGNAPAVLRLSDGSRAEFLPGSEGVIHRPSESVRQGLELKQGGGTFKVVQGKGKFQVETVVGSVSALGTEFSVKLQTPPRGREERRNRRPVMTVTVTEGSVKVETRSRSVTLNAGEKREFTERTRREDDD
jgi:ferric-dicitrate binding protein FerR (iron transport regulator)